MSKPDILIVGNPNKGQSSVAFLEKFVKIIKELGNKIYIFSAEKPPKYDNVSLIQFSMSDSPFMQHVEQVGYIKKLNNGGLSYDIVMVLPITFFILVIYLKLTRKKVILFAAQLPISRKGWMTRLMIMSAKISIMLSDIIIVESPNVIKEWRIDSYLQKIVIGNIYVHERFRKEKNISDREEIVGFIGYLQERKGVKELISAISILNTEEINISFLIGGNGHLQNMVEEFSNNNRNVKYIGTVSDNEITKIYNRLKILILPSYSEGVPNVIIEAMACGTIVLTTPVGGIPDIIKDGHTGFIMENNSPDCIARNIIRVLNSPNLEKISDNANRYITKEFNYHAAVERYRHIIGRVYD